MANTNEEPTYKYSQEEIDQAWDFHQAIVASGDVPLDTVARDVGVSAVSGVLTYFLFWPAIGGLWIANMIAKTPFRHLMWFGLPETSGGAMILIVLFINILYALCALYGFICFVNETLFSKEEEYKQLFKEHAAKMEEALDQQEKSYVSEIDELKTQLETEQTTSNLREMEKENLTSLIEQNKKEYDTQLSRLKEEFERERRIWSLEKRELELELKSKKYRS